jgi:hypothetical protein
MKENGPVVSLMHAVSPPGYTKLISSCGIELMGQGLEAVMWHVFDTVVARASSRCIVNEKTRSSKTMSN